MPKTRALPVTGDLTAKKLGIAAETMKALTDIPTTLGRSEHCAPQIVYSVAIGWRDKAYPGKEPSGWAEFWDTKKFPGQRSVRKHPIPLKTS